MGSIIYRDRERDRFDDSRTNISTARRTDERGGGYTTVKRYVVKGEDDSRSSFGGGSRIRPERVEETRIVRREVDVEEPRRHERREERREDPRSSDRELIIRRDRGEEEPRRDYGRRDDRTDEREIVIRRTTEREEPSRERDLTIARYDDRRDDRYDLDIRRGDYGDRDLQRYNRTTEYFQPAQPQTIVIRNEIVMPRGRDDDFDNIRRSEADEERSVVKREPSGGRGEEFFYEKKVRERIEEPPRREDDHWDDRRSRREISPHDSVSQVGRRDRGYSSDDSMVYVRHKVTEDEGYDGSRSPKHKRHIAEGAIAGIGVAELLRHHKSKEGGETSGGIGRIGRDVGAGALGALAAEGVTRARSAYRERSKSRRRSRSSSGGRGGRSRAGSRRGRDRSRSRSESTSGVKKLAGLGLGAAAIAAAAIYAQKRNKQKSQSPNGRGRSSSRRRGSSVPPSETDDARNPSHRNKIMAEAGAAGAVLAALVERQRSKSRGGRERSKVRQALPVIAAGLGSAGIAALYEKNKAKKETEAAATAQRRASRSRSRSRSRGRGRSADPYYDGPRGAAMSDPNLIEYGEGNVYGNNYGADYYGQPPPGDSYYNNHQNAVVPAVAGAGAYGASREARPSRSRSPSSQSSSDDGGRRRRRHRRKRGSRSRSAGKEAATAVGGVAAASEYERSKQERRDRKARKREWAFKKFCGFVLTQTQARNSREGMLLKTSTRIHTILSNSNNIIMHPSQPTTHMPLKVASIRRANSSHHHPELLLHSSKPRRQRQHTLPVVRTILTTSHHLQGLHLLSTLVTSQAVATQTLMHLVAVALMRT